MLNTLFIRLNSVLLSLKKNHNRGIKTLTTFKKDAIWKAEMIIKEAGIVTMTLSQNLHLLVTAKIENLHFCLHCMMST